MAISPQCDAFAFHDSARVRNVQFDERKKAPRRAGLLVAAVRRRLLLHGLALDFDFDAAVGLQAGDQVLAVLLVALHHRLLLA